MDPEKDPKTEPIVVKIKRNIKTDRERKTDKKEMNLPDNFVHDEPHGKATDDRPDGGEGENNGDLPKCHAQQVLHTR